MQKLRNERTQPRENDRSNERDPRKKRTRLGEPTSILEAEHREGYHRCWINDYPAGHLVKALDSGYEFVKSEVKGLGGGQLRGHELASMRSEQVGTKPDGSVMLGYLMEIRQDWYEEDSAEQLKRALEIDEQIRSGTAGDDSGLSNENRYIPEGGIKYQT